MVANLVFTPPPKGPQALSRAGLQAACVKITKKWYTPLPKLLYKLYSTNAIYKCGCGPHNTTWHATRGPHPTLDTCGEGGFGNSCTQHLGAGYITNLVYRYLPCCCSYTRSKVKQRTWLEVGFTGFQFHKNPVQDCIFWSKSCHHIQQCSILIVLNWSPAI